MSQLTVTQCAQITGFSKRTIQNNVKSGKLSAERLESGKYMIDESELFRAYPEAPKHANNKKFVNEVRGNLDAIDAVDYNEIKTKNEVLEAENRSLKRENDLLAAQLKKSEDRESDLIEISKSSTRLLENKNTQKRKKIFGLI